MLSEHQRARCEAPEGTERNVQRNVPRLAAAGLAGPTGPQQWRQAADLAAYQPARPCQGHRVHAARGRVRSAAQAEGKLTTGLSSPPLLEGMHYISIWSQEYIYLLKDFACQLPNMQCLNKQFQVKITKRVYKTITLLFT